MASLNWALLSSPPGLSPLPLPHEKFLLAVPSTDLHLAPSPPGAPINPPAPPAASVFTAKGAVHLSNKRLVFVAADAHSSASGIGTGVAAAAAALAGERTKLNTFSVPYSHFLDGRFVQPWFGANYYEALCLPSDGGGLSTPHLLKLTFKEAGGGQFYEVVEEMKNRLEASGSSGSGRGTPMEALPLYTPPAVSTSNTTTSQPAPPSSVPAPTSPTDGDLLAASIARSAEEAEDTAATVQQQERNVRPPPPSPGPAAGGGDGPPSYEP